MKKLIRGLVLRWRLWRVCKKLGIKPYKWQKDYALGKSQYLAGGRRSGKTMAVMLWALIRKVQRPGDIGYCAHKDPDTTNRVILNWWAREYERLADKARQRVQMQIRPCPSCEHSFWGDPECNDCSKRDGFKRYEPREMKKEGKP